jgi:hypothetical protein
VPRAEAPSFALASDIATVPMDKVNYTMTCQLDGGILDHLLADASSANGWPLTNDHS